MRPDVTLGLQRPSWDGVVVDYSLFSPSSGPLAGSTYGFGVGADVGGGSLEMLAQSVGPAERGQLHVDASWTGVWRENRWVKQLRFGDVASTGPRSRALGALARAGWTGSVLAGLASRSDAPLRGAGRQSEQRLGDPERSGRCGTRARRSAIRAVRRSPAGRRVRAFRA